MTEPTLKQVDLLVLPQVHLMDLAGPAQVFASDELSLGIRFFGPSKAVSSAQGLSVSALESLPLEVPEQSCLVVVGSRNMHEQLNTEPFRQATRWLKSHADRYMQLAAVCSGSLLLGHSGLLHQRRCTTHHDLLQKLALVAPTARIEENCLFIEDGKIITSAGISTGVDLSLQLVGKYWNPSTAQKIARDMVVYQRRPGNAQTLSFWLQHRNHIAREVHAVQDRIMQSPGLMWRVADIASEVHLSERQFRRRFQKATGETFQNYLQLARLELSRQLLQQTHLPIAEIAGRCGFADERSLRRLWQSHEGCSPTSIRCSD